MIQASAAATTVEMRSPLYEDVRSLLTLGFLSSSLSANGVRMSLRTLLPADQFLLKHRAGEMSDQRSQNWFLAMSVWMLDGQILLGDDQAVYQMYKLCEQFPAHVKTSIFNEITLLQANLLKSAHRSQSFFYEDESRFLWRAYGHDIGKRSGVSGVDHLGMNLLQLMWASYNEMEDLREEWMVGWMQTKLLAATQSPKGIAKLNRADDAAQKRDDERRQRIRDVMFHKAHGREVDADGRSLEVAEQGIRMASTPEELEEEMRKVRLGIKDDHDRVVDDFKARARARVEGEKQAQRERIEQVQREMELAGVTEPSLRPLMVSAESLEKRLAERSTTKRVFYSNKSNTLYDRYISSEVKAGRLKFSPGGAPIAVPDGGSLQEEVVRRGGSNG